MDTSSNKNLSHSYVPSDTLKQMMSINIRDAKDILELSKANGCMDSQEFMNWQDTLNAISVTYYNKK